MSRNRQGLYKLPPDAVVRARNEAAAQVNRILITFVGVTLFCLLSLVTPDSAFITGNEKLSVPFAGPVNLEGFMWLSLVVLIILRVYLQIYIEYERRLDTIARSTRIRSVPTPDRNPLIRKFRDFVIYLLLPVTLLAIWWKAAVLDGTGFDILIIVLPTIVMHATLLFGWLTWPQRWRLFFGISAVGAVLTYVPGMKEPLRAFDLERTNLADQVFVLRKMRSAQMSSANLARADFYGADLTSAQLDRANLTAADLHEANLTKANLHNANLSDANLRKANLSGANLTGAIGLTQKQLDAACMDAATRLPQGLMVGQVCRDH